MLNCFSGLLAQSSNAIFIKQLNTCGPFLIFGVPNKMLVVLEGVYCKDYTVECEKCIAKKDTGCVVEIIPTDSTGDINYTISYKGRRYSYTGFARQAAPPHLTINSWRKEPAGYKLDSLICYNGENCLPLEYKVIDFDFEFAKGNQIIYRSRSAGPKFKNEDQIASEPLMPGDTIRLYNINIIGSDNVYRTIKQCFLVVP